MRILIAPNAFKNSLPATGVAGAICEGLLQSRLNCSCECFPICDGGDGTMELITLNGKGTFETAQVSDPLGRPVNARYGIIDHGKTAVIGISEASGLCLLKPEEYDPLHANTCGTGELIVHALNKEVNKIIIALGGSATVDGGTGLLTALGVKFLTSAKKAITDLPSGLTGLSEIDISGLDKRLQHCTVTVMCDVATILRGHEGTAAIYGPQKGAAPADIATLEDCLSAFAKATSAVTGKEIDAVKHGGAAGGTAAGLYAFLNASLVNGSESFLDLSFFDDALDRCDLLITGEGSIDEQTARGKGPFEVARRARSRKIPVIGMAGKLSIDKQPACECFDALLSICNEPDDLDTALKNTAQNLIRTATAVGNVLNLSVNVFVNDAEHQVK